MGEYEDELARLKARKDFARQEQEERNRKDAINERIRCEEAERERKLRAEYERLKRSGMILPPYEEWKRNTPRW